MAPLIAIVGRPNVGKSTLFNRLSSGGALVADLPGITRDYLQGEGDFEGRSYTLLDTSGLPGTLVRSASGLEAEAVARTLERIRTADVLLWLVDARAGLLPADTGLAEQLRRLEIPCVLAVNKAEGMESELAAADFYGLGMGEPHPVSALHGSGLNDLMDALLQHNEAETHDDTLSVDPIIPGIVVVGRPNVGKSTLVNRILRTDRMLTSGIPGTTHDNVASELRRKGHVFKLIDTPGIRRRARVQEELDLHITRTALSALKQAHTAILVVDADDGITEQDARLAGRVLELGVRLMVAVNKWDLVPREQSRDRRAGIVHKLRFAAAVRINYVSALKGKGIGGLCAELDHTSDLHKPSTSVLCRLMREAVAHRPPPVVGGRRIHLMYAHTGGLHPLRIIIHGRGGGMPASYRRYLENRLRGSLKLPGRPIRIEYVCSGRRGRTRSP